MGLRQDNKIKTVGEVVLFLDRQDSYFRFSDRMFVIQRGNGIRLIKTGPAVLDAKSRTISIYFNFRYLRYDTIRVGRRNNRKLCRATTRNVYRKLLLQSPFVSVRKNYFFRFFIR